MSENITYLNSAGTFEGTVLEPGEGGWFQEMGEKLTPCIRIPIAVFDTDGKEKVAIWRGWLSDKALDNTTRTLAKVFGFDGNYAELSAGKQTFAAKSCQIVTEMEEYEKKMRMKVKWLNPPDSKAPTMDKAKVESIIGKITARSKAVAKAELSAGGAKPAPAKVEEEEEEDEIPD